MGLIRPGREMVGRSDPPCRVWNAGGQGRGGRHAAERAMIAIGCVFLLAAVFPAAVSIIDSAEAQFAEVRREAAGRRRREGGGGAEGEPGLGQEGQNAKNSRDQPTTGMAVSRRDPQFGCCQRGMSHVITIAGAAGSG